MTYKVQLIKEEIERMYKKAKSVDCFTSSVVETTLERLSDFIDSLPEEHNEDLDFLVISLEETIGTSPHSREVIKEHLQKAAEWQKQKDEKLFKEDSWNYIEENYPNISQEEKLRLYDISIKSRLAGANAIKEHMKETLQTEYEKGRFDMMEEMMKDAMEGVVHHFPHDELAAVHYNDPKGTPMSIYVSSKGLSAGDKVKIIICKPEQQ